jgi:hypothetical protein
MARTFFFRARGGKEWKGALSRVARVGGIQGGRACEFVLEWEGGARTKAERVGGGGIPAPAVQGPS